MHAGPGIEGIADDNPGGEIEKLTDAVSHLKLSETSKEVLFKKLIASIENQDIQAFNNLINLKEIQHVVALVGGVPLGLAVFHGNLDMVKRLLNFHAVLLELPSHADAVIACAAYRHGYIMVKHLLQFQAFRDVVASNNNQALYWALFHSDLDMVNLLLEFPAVSNRVAADENYLLDYTVFKRNFVMLDRLLACKEVQAELEVSGHRTLSTVAKTGDIVMLEKLLNIPVVRSAVAAESNLALCFAASFGQIDAFNHLLEYEEVRKELAINWLLPLRLAVEGGHINVVERLVHFGGESILQDLAKDFPKVYSQVLNGRITNAHKALILSKGRSTEGLRLPKELRHKILCYTYHNLACGQHHTVIYKDGTGEEGCKETARFIISALDERRVQNESIFKKLRKYFRCGC